ncbi:hypothetical protein [Virgibacillus kimchii]
MELIVSQNGAVTSSSNEPQVKVVPTKYTYNMLERWHEAYKNDFDNSLVLPDKELVESKDWYEIGKCWIEQSSDLHPDVYEYIRIGGE